MFILENLPYFWKHGLVQVMLYKYDVKDLNLSIEELFHNSPGNKLVETPNKGIKKLLPV